MQSLSLVDNAHDTSAALQSRVEQLEETVVELYQSFCSVYGMIDFAQLSPEDFDTPYSIHTVSVPNTKLSVTFVTTPPHLVIGMPASHTPGPLQWEHELKIELPAHTIFVSFHYGGEAGQVQWFSSEDQAHPVAALSTLTMRGDTGHFYLAHHEGIHSVQLVSSGKMFLTTLSVGISALPPVSDRFRRSKRL